MATWKKYAIGIGLILSAVSAWVIATFDDKADTNVTISETVEKVNEGINVLKSDVANDSTEKVSEVK